MLLILAGALAVAPSAVRPSLTIQYERRDLRVLQPAFFLSMRLAAVCATAAVIALWIGGHALIRLWAGAGIFPGAWVFGLQLAFFFILVLLFPCYTVLMAATRHYGYATASLIEAFAGFALSVWWVNRFGLAGVIAGAVCARLLTTGWYMPLATAAVLGLSGEEMMRELQPLLLYVVPALCVLPLAVAAGGRRDVGSIWVAALAASAYALAFVFVAFDGEERYRLWRLLTARAGREALV
jgi:O-antigen/teichoic acid export membrane protein